MQDRNKGAGQIEQEKEMEEREKGAKERRKVPNIKNYFPGVNKDQRDVKAGVGGGYPSRPADKLEIDQIHVVEEKLVLQSRDILDNLGRKERHLAMGEEIRNEKVAVKEEEKLEVKQGVREGEEQKLDIRSKQVLMTKLNSKYFPNRGPYSLTRGKNKGNNKGKTMRAPGVRKVKDLMTRDIQAYFTKLKTRHEVATGPKSLVNLLEGLEENQVKAVIVPKAEKRENSSGGINTECSGSVTNGCSYQTGNSLDKDSAVSDY